MAKIKTNSSRIKIIAEIPQIKRRRMRIRRESELEEEIAHAEKLSLKEVFKKRDEEEAEKIEKEKEKKNTRLERDVEAAAPVPPPENEQNRTGREAEVIHAYAVAREEKNEYRIVGQERPAAIGSEIPPQRNYSQEENKTGREYEREKPHEKEDTLKRKYHHR